MKMAIKPTPLQIATWVRNHFDYKVKKQGEELRICNPYDYPKDTKFHVFVNTQKAKVNDFRPNHKRNISGTFLNFVRRYRRISFHEAVKEVMGNVDPRMYRDSGPEPKLEATRQFVELPADFKQFGSLDEDDAVATAVRLYLHRRMITDEQIGEFGIGYGGLAAVFPYYEFGDIVYWQSRSIINKKFNFPDGSTKTKFIYGFDNLDPEYPVIITESVTNALMFEHGGSVGGCDVSDDQKRRLKAAGISDIILALDNDQGGREGIASCYQRLSPIFNLYYALTDREDDWNKIAQNEGLTAVYEMLMKNVKKLTLGESVRLRL